MPKDENIKKIRYSSSMLVSKTVLPALYLMILGVLFSVLFKTGIGKYTEQRKLIKESQMQENILNEKINYLNDNQNTIKTNASITTLALPEKNPVLVVMSQIKSIQNLEGATMLSNIRVTSPGKSGASSSLSMSFNIDGTMDGIYSFMEKIMNMLPVVTINKFTLSGSGESYSADVKVSAYWENLPEKIPSVTDPLKPLGKNSDTLIAKLRLMEKPTFSSVSPQIPSTRANPFK